ncbi:Uncharacterized protein MSYG_2581 [Malassezia sympodialis ATCC 42132]|uniref:Uncharacterized protein n=1 Tax=Malassezia sympodialis (strain ATCC 42132) TaxID=1230383 RepID=A0A1M8A776_MALS4|nr:Uncharacterized protein MSYG_2581 [Malassezia sympodialis ATCC 42132]
MAAPSGAPAPLLQTPIQLSTYSRARSPHTHELCASSTSHQHRSSVAVGEVVRVSGRGLRRRRGLLATLEQGVAIVLMDLHTQTPVHTYTLAPSDRACTPPLVVEARATHGTRPYLRTTYYGVVADDGAHTRVHAITEHLDARGQLLAAAPDTAHTSFVVPGILATLHPIGPAALFATRRDGAVVLLHPSETDALTATYTAAPVVLDVQRLCPTADAPLVRATGAAPDDAPLGALALVAAERDAASAHLHVVTAHAAAPFLRAQSCALPAGDARHLVSCAVHASGRVAALQRDGTLVTLRVTAPSPGVLALEPAPAPAPAVALRITCARLVFLSASHLLLVALHTEGGKARAAALVWDVDLDAVLAVVEWSLSVSGAGCVSAARVLDDHVLVQIDPADDSALKSSIAALPVSVPPAGLLRHALGAAARTQPWLAAPPAAPLLSTSQQALRAALDALPTEPAACTRALDEQFRAWVQGETERVRAAEQIKAGRKAPRVAIDSALVAAVLDRALPAYAPGHTGPAPFARETVRFLLERGYVSAAASVPHLVARVQATHDWSVRILLLRHVPDLSEAHAVALLQAALAARDDAGTPPVARVLQHVLAPPSFSKPALRMALRTHIQRDDDVLLLLDILHLWLDRQLAAPLDGRVPREAEAVRTVPHTSIVYRTGDVVPPSLEMCVSFAEDLLDTFFPQWIAAPRTHAFLRDWARGVAQHVQALQALERLRAPLASVTARATEAPDTRSRRAELHEASLLVPVYAIEALEI